MSKLVFASVLVLCFAAAVLADSDCYDPTFTPPAPALVVATTKITNNGLFVDYLSSKYFRSYAVNFASPAGIFSTICDTTASLGAIGSWSATRVGSTCNQNLLYSVAASQVPDALSACFTKFYELAGSVNKTVYSANVRLTTVQDLPSLRNGRFNLTKTVITGSRFQFKFQTSLTLTNNKVKVAGNVSVEAAVIEQIFNPFVTNSATRSRIVYGAESTVIRLLTTAQWPYYLSPNSAAALTLGYDLYGDTNSISIEQVEFSQDGSGNLYAASCDLTTVDSICLQLWEVVLQHPDGVCNIAAEIQQTFDVGCRGGRNCNGTSQDLSFISNYNLTTNDYCIQTVQDVTAFGSLETYFNIEDINSKRPTTDFIFDQFVYCVAYVASSDPNLDLDYTETRIISIRISSFQYSTNAPDGYNPLQNFNVNNGQNGIAFRFQLNANSVHLADADLLQNITIEATIELKYVNVPTAVTKKLLFTAPPSPSSSPSHFSTQAEPSSLAVSSRIGLAPQGSINAPGTGASSTASSSTSMVALVAGVVGGCMFVIAIAAIVVYRRRQNKTVAKSPQVLQVFVPSSSTSQMTTTQA